MKLLISSIAAILAGTLAALLIPFGEGAVNLFAQFANLSLNIGRYVIFPLVFFSLAVSVCKLKREKSLLKTMLFTVIFTVGTTVVLVILAVAAALIFSPSRIPLIVETQSTFDLGDQAGFLISLFPRNMFTVFTGSSNVLMPLYFLSFLLGYIMFKDKEISEPAFNLFDSLSRILFELNIYVTKITPVLLLGLSFNLVKSLKKIAEPSMFLNLILILAILSLIVIFLVYPFVLYITDKSSNPYKTLYAMVLPLLTGLVSGDSFFSLTMLTRSAKKDLEISRNTAALTLPFNAMFAKAGTALVTAVTFLTILKSYSSLEITLYQIFWVILFSILVSFTLASFPAMGVYAALYMLSGFYSKTHTGLTDSYLLIKPVIPILVGFAVLLDVATSALITVLVNRKRAD